MNRQVRHAAALSLALLVALLVNAARVQLWRAEEYNGHPGNRRPAVLRYEQPRGDILVAGRPVTGSRDSGQRLRWERRYPEGPLYAPVTGYSSQLYGPSQVEAAEDAVLAGTDPRLAPLPLWDRFTGSRRPGGDVVTTLDPAVQRAAFAALGARRGAVVALQPRTGRILALVSSPSYDPERLSGTGQAVTAAWHDLDRDPGRPLLNRALAAAYPPGSTFKIVTAAAALDAGEVPDADTATDTPDPYLLPATRTRLVNEASGCARATLREAFVRSCNTVFAHLGERLGSRAMAQAAERFGFNDATLRVPSPVARSTFETTMDPAQTALSAIGQFDTTATPLQMAMVASAVATGGDLVAPHLVERVTDAGGAALPPSPGRASRRAMTPATAEQLQELMVDAVAHGTGRNAAIPGATVGGKTGTAQHGPHNSGKPYAWFVAWARAANAPDPAVAVAVVVEDAAARRADISGGGNAAPVARTVMRAVLR
ncbi:peptidoglycan D,D-transpeptidase FtsI family protein [Streptomyces sp. NPDC059740]|uniref:peptidoglycan D,D-transpeptidase FtsI family protein n=1 Tax=Streptomyces sp. NPDC059740 TaxID=3346926 RepID=UPI0036662877